MVTGAHLELLERLIKEEAKHKKGMGLDVTVTGGLSARLAKDGKAAAAIVARYMAHQNSNHGDRGGHGDRHQRNTNARQVSTDKPVANPPALTATDDASHAVAGASHTSLTERGCLLSNRASTIVNCHDLSSDSDDNEGFVLECGNDIDTEGESVLGDNLAQ